MCEDAPCCGCCGLFAGEAEPQEGWPGDGSGTDDLADYNANEADDYRDEGGGPEDGPEDQHLDASWEDRFDGGE
jgi:hypothetical protein